jgi:hypothetical protein
MDLRVYEVLLQFNQGLDQALASLDTVEKLELGSPYYVELRACANNHFACKIAKKEQEEENHFYRIRRKREKAKEDPNDIYLGVKAREWLRRERGLPPRAVVLPRTQADDDRIFVMQEAASSAPPLQPEQSRTTGDANEEGPEGGSET